MLLKVGSIRVECRRGLTYWETRCKTRPKTEPPSRTRAMRGETSRPTPGLRMGYCGDRDESHVWPEHVPNIDISRLFADDACVGRSHAGSPDFSLAHR